MQAYHQEEQQQFAAKLDQLDSKWKVFTLSKRAAKYHGDAEQEHARSSGRWEEDHGANDEYPVLKVEDTRDGNLHVTRNIVLDTSDENEDGYVNMRVGIAIVEFPSIFELYNEHQECSVNIIKMEEDEEMAQLKIDGSIKGLPRGRAASGRSHFWKRPRPAEPFMRPSSMTTSPRDRVITG